jgi:hypothetical protein
MRRNETPASTNQRPCQRQARGARRLLLRVAQQRPGEWRLDRLSFEGDTAPVTLGCDFAGTWCSDDLSMLKVDGQWRIVHKTFYAHPA